MTAKGRPESDLDSRTPETMFAKIWSRHQILERDDGQVLLYVDRHFIHDVSAVAFDELRRRGLKTRAPQRTFGTPDHYVPTDSRDYATIADPEKRGMAQALMTDSAAAGITCLDLDDPRQGIVHVVGPEQGLSWPGTIIVCADSHTSTHGALGALAFGIGATEMTHVLATQSLWQRRPKTMRITVDGRLGHGVCAKDVVLAIIARIGAAGATGHVIEYAGSAIAGLSMEGRLTVCNMSIEAGARAGMIAPDDTTFEYLAGRPYAPAGREWETALARWRALPSDPGAAFDREVALDAARIEPMVTWGTSPEDAAPITGCVPDPADAPSAERRDCDRARTGVHGPAAGHPPDRRARRSRVHRLLHQRPHRGPAQRGGGRCGPQGRRRRRGLGRSRLGARQGAGRSGRAGPRCSSMPGSSGGTRVARCASAPTATSRVPASVARRRRTAISSAGRARARAPTCSVRRWPRRRR